MSILSNRAHLRAALREDAIAAGAQVRFSGSLGEFVELPCRALGDLVWFDCPVIDAEALAALAQLDMKAATGAIRLIVSTTVGALDHIYAWMDQSDPMLLVDPGRVDRVIALARGFAGLPGRGGVRELSDDDRMMLMRLTEQVGAIAGRIERLSPGGQPREGGIAAPVQHEPVATSAVPALFGSEREGAAQLPDPRFVRRIIRQRQQRARFFDADLFADPAWDMMLDLCAARVEGQRVSVTSLCIASGVPPTTALRWIGQMVEAGLFTRACDDADRRRAFIELSEGATEAMARYFREVAIAVPAPV